MSRRHPLLAELEHAIDTQVWDEAERLLRAAQNLGLTHSKYGIPLRYILNDLPNQRTAAANKAAQVLMTTAAALAVAGQTAQARQHYTQAAAIAAISDELKQQITAALAALDDAIAYGAPPAPGVEHELEAMMAQLLFEIKEQQPTLATLLAACAIPLWWDEGLLAAIRNRHDGREPIILEKLSHFSFVYAWAEHYTYSRLARRLLLQSWEADPTGFQAQNQQILAHLQQRLDLNPPLQPAAYTRLVQAHLYHTFLADPAAGVVRLGELMQKAEDNYQLEAARQYVWVLKELQPRLPSAYSAWIDYAEGWLHHLNQRDAVAQQTFQELLARPDLPPNLRARVERGLGLALVAKQNWVEASQHHHAALALFQQQQNSREVAETMANLGDTYLNIAQTAYGHSDEFDLDESLGSQFAKGISFVARLPLIFFLVWKLNLNWDVRIWWRLGRGMDWVVARLFSEAIVWFRQAEAIYQQLDDQIGLKRTQVSLGRLYLALNHGQAATAIFRQVAANAPVDSYQQALAHLELAEALLRQHQLDEAERLLQQALPIFTRLNHTRRIAQTQSRLGTIAAQARRGDAAMAAYQAALVAWQKVGNTARVTDLLHAMELLGSRAELSALANEQLATAQQQNPQRVYETRFVHPTMATFQRYATIMLWVVIFIALLTSIRSESGTMIGATAILKLPTEAELVAAFKPTVGAASGEVLSEIQKQVAPHLRSRFLGTSIAGALLAYLSLYTVLGLYLITKTTMGNVQAQQECWLEVDETTIVEVENKQIRTRLYWADVRTYIMNQRLLFGGLLELVSSVTLLDADSYINIAGNVRHYWTLTQAYLARRLPPQVLRINTGYALPFGFFGWLLTIVLALFIAFVGLIVTNSPLAITPLLFLPYTPADLYGLLFLAGALAAVYWFVIQSIRNYLIRQPRRTTLRGIALASLGLGIFSLFQFHRWHLPFGRPDLLLSALTILLAGFALHQHFLITQRANRLRFYANGSVIIAALAIGFAFWTIKQELRSFDSLAQANGHFLQAEKLKGQDEKAAEREYQQALTRYTETLSLRQEAYVYNSLGNVYLQLKEYEKALEAYQAAQQGNPSELNYSLNLALAYREWAATTKDFPTREQYYRQALAEYDQVIAGLDNAPSLRDDEKANQWSAHELRAATWHELGTMYYALDQGWQPALEYFTHAKRDYEWLIAQNPAEPASYVGKGWTLFYLRSEHPPAEKAVRRQYFEAAITEFSTAIAKDPTYSPAYNGLGWMHWYISNESIPGNCIAGIDPVLKADYQAQIEAAVEAFTQGVAADSGNGFFFRTRAQLYYILSYCEPDAKIEYLGKAVADYDLALANDPPVEWHWRQGTIYQELATNLEKTGRNSEARTAREAAVQSNLNALKQDPNYPRPYDSLPAIYAKLGRTSAQAFERIVATMQEKSDQPKPIKPNFTQLARKELTRGDWTLAIKAAAIAIAADPNAAEAYLIQAQAFQRLGAPVQAQAALTKVAKLQLDNPSLSYELGLMHLLLGNLAQAQTAYRAGNQATAALADQSSRLPIYAKAIKDVLIAPAPVTNDAVPLALSIVDTLLPELTIVTRTASGYFEAGQAALTDKQYALAVPLLVQAVRLDPTAFRYWIPLRTALIDGYAVSQTDSGAAVLTLLLGVSVGTDPYAKLLEIAQAELGRDTFGLAVVALDRALVLYPDRLEILLLKAQAYQRWGDKFPTAASVLTRYQSAVEAAQEALKLNPESVEAHLLLGRVQRQLEQGPESLAAYEQALELAADDDTAAWVAYLRGDYAQATTLWAALIARNPTELRYYFNQGLALVALGDQSAAQQSYTAGIAAADALDTVPRAVALYQAAADLYSIQVDPTASASQLIDLLTVTQ